MPVIAAVTISLVLFAAVGSTMAVMGVMMMGSDHGGMMGGGMMGGGMMGWARGSSADQTPVVSSARDITIEIRDFDFYPADLTVDAGTGVTWVNRDSVAHTATARSDAWDSGSLGRDEEYTLVFDTPGTYEYYCRPHPFMVGTVTVQQPSTAANTSPTQG